MTKKTSELKKVERKLKAKKTVTSTSDDPRAELKRIVRTHAALTKAAVALNNMSSDHQREDGEIIKCMLPADDIADMQLAAKRRRQSASRMEGVTCPDGKPGMKHELRKLEIYNVFLEKVFGLGVVTSAYLCAFVDIHKAEKPSQLIRYCGYACIEGEAERRREGFAPKTGETGKEGARGTYNAKLKTKLYLGMKAIWTNGAPCATRGAVTTKYLDRWRNEKSRRLLRGETKGKAHDAGRRAATDLLLYDLYLVWRAIEGLPSWVTWYDWTRGYEHGRGLLPRENHPRMLTLEEALELVGDVGARELVEAA
jgi:hypothetical protein